MRRVSFRRHPGVVTSLLLRQLAVVLVVAVVAAGGVALGGLGGESLARVQRETAVQWRPVYDLLVLGPDAEVAVPAAGQRLTQANFLATLDGGISVGQWRQILDVPGVEVAAPIATVGYFRRPRPTFYFPALPAGVYAIERTVSWDSGLGPRVQGHTTGDRPVTRDIVDCKALYPSIFYARGVKLVSDDGSTKAALRAAFGDFYTTGIFPGEQGSWEELYWPCSGLDPGGVFGVYGIDPVQEAKLVGLQRQVEGDYLRGEEGLTDADFMFCKKVGKGCKQVQQLPLLVNTDGWVDTRMQLNFHRYHGEDLHPGELAERGGKCTDPDDTLTGPSWRPRCQAPEVMRAVKAAGTRRVLATELPLDDAFVGGQFALRRGKWKTITRTFSADLPYLSRPSRVSYRPAVGGPEGPWATAVVAQPSGSYGPEPTFRTQRPPASEPLLRYDVRGSFDGAAIAARFSAKGGWLPEDTYRPPRAVARFDDAGDPVAPRVLRPTANPLGYLVEPPRAFTTIAAAQQLLESEEPISAVRVRVAGVAEPGEAAWSRVEDVARRIREVTGLEPVVTLGAAPARVLVKVPGVSLAEQPSGRQTWRQPRGFFLRDGPGPQRFYPPPAARPVAGFGWVEEPWLVQGAAISYLRAGAAQHAWLLGVLALSAAVYLGATFTSLGLAEIPTIAIRRAVGWSRRRVLLAELVRAARLSLLGSLLGVGVAVLVATVTSWPLNPVLVALAVPGATTLGCLAAVIPAWRVSRIPVAAVLAGGETVLGARRASRRGRVAVRLPGIAAAELHRLRARVAVAALAGVVAATSILALTAVQARFAGSLQVTVLGQAILVRTGGLQTAAVVLTAGLALALLAELLWQLVLDRRRQIGMLRAIGWRRRHVTALMIWQATILAVGCCVFGVLVAALLLWWLLGAAFSSGTLGTPLLAAVALGTALGVLAAGPPAARAARAVPAAILRGP